MNFNHEWTLFWENEDELPDMPDEVYKAMYPLSKVDFVRYFPYMKIDGTKVYLISLEIEEENKYDITAKDFYVVKKISRRNENEL